MSMRRIMQKYEELERRMTISVEMKNAKYPLKRLKMYN